MNLQTTMKKDRSFFSAPTLDINSRLRTDARGNVPILTRAEEKALIARAQKDGSDAILASEELIIRHFPFIMKFVLRLASRGNGNRSNDQAKDLLSGAYIGFLDAIKKYDLDSGFRLSTYAIHWMKDRTFKAFGQLAGPVVKIPGLDNARFGFLSRHLSKIRQDLGYFPGDGKFLTEEQLVSLTNTSWVNMDRASMVRVAAYFDYMLGAYGTMSPTCSIDGPVHGGEDERSLLNILSDPTPSPDEVLEGSSSRKQAHNIIHDALENCGLSERDKTIFTQRCLVDEPPTLHELGERFNISRERIRQIENRSIKKITRYIKKHYSAKDL